LSGVVLRPDGRLTADSGTIERLKRLCAEDAKALRESSRPERPPSPQPVDDDGTRLRASDDDIEVCLAGLMTEVAKEAKRCFALARDATVEGGLIEARSVHLYHGARLAKAFAALTVALSRHRGKSQRLILEHYVHRGV
jgi:hypothetical protein